MSTQKQPMIESGIQIRLIKLLLDENVINQATYNKIISQIQKEAA